MKMPRHYFESAFSRFEPYLLTKRHTHVPFEKGDDPLHSVPVANAYFYILQGSCAVYSVTEHGARKTTCFYSGGTFANLALEDEIESIYVHQSLEALCSGVLLLFDKATILEIIGENPAFVLQMFSFTNELLALLAYQNLTLPCLASRTKLCDCLYMLYHYHGRYQKQHPHRLWFSQEQLADCIGVTRTQVTRLLRQLKEETLIETHRGSVEITDPPRLLEHCSNVVNCQ